MLRDDCQRGRRSEYDADHSDRRCKRDSARRGEDRAFADRFRLSQFFEVDPQEEATPQHGLSTRSYLGAGSSDIFTCKKGRTRTRSGSSNGDRPTTGDQEKHLLLKSLEPFLRWRMTRGVRAKGRGFERLWEICLLTP